MNTTLNGNKIKQIRKSLGLTQRDFAAELGITYPYLSDLEREKKSPSKQLVNLILTKNKAVLVETGQGEMKKAEPVQNDPILNMLDTLLKKCEKIENEMAELRKRLDNVEKLPSGAERKKKNVG